MDTSPPRFVSRLELIGAHSAEVAVTACRIVEGLDVVGCVREREPAGLVDVLLDALLRKRPVEAVLTIRS